MSYDRNDEMAPEEFQKQVRELLLGKRVAKIDQDTMYLDDGTALELYESGSDCCAGAWGEWDLTTDDLEAGITDVEFSEIRGGYDGDGHSYEMNINILHNQNLIAQGYGSANDGNGGYYFSVLSLRVRSVNGKTLLDKEVLSA